MAKSVSRTPRSRPGGRLVPPQRSSKPAQPAPEPAIQKPAVAVTPVIAPKASDVASAPVATPTSAAPVGAALPADRAATTLAKDDMMIGTDTTKAMFDKVAGNFGDRTKGAVEKSTQLFEEMNAFGKGNIEAIVESSKIAAKNLETLGQEAAARAKTSFEGMTEAARTLAAAKSPTEFLKLQGDYARTAFDAMIAEGSRSTEQFLKMMGEVAQPISNRVAVATEKMKIAA